MRLKFFAKNAANAIEPFVNVCNVYVYTRKKEAKTQNHVKLCLQSDNWVTWLRIYTLNLFLTSVLTALNFIQQLSVDQSN